MTQYVVISGGSGALGTVVSKRLAELGYGVHILDLNPPTQELGEQIHFHATNVLDRQALENVQAQLKAHEVYALLNIMGGFHWGLFEETPLHTLDKMLDLNLRSAFALTQSILPQLKSQNKGRIINIGARPAVQPTVGMSAYAMSKAGILSFTETLAEELKQTDITVNALLPSVIDTPQNRQDMPEANPKDWVSPEQLCHVIEFLLSPKSQAISGALIPVYHKA